MNKNNIKNDFNKLIKIWKQFIQECEDGYHWEYGEYIYEVSKRDEIEKMFLNSEYNEVNEYREVVQQLDERFKKLLNPYIALTKHNSWWMNGILKSAGEDYVLFMKSVGAIVETKRLRK